MTATPYTDAPPPLPPEVRARPTERPPLPAQVRRHAELALRLSAALAAVEAAQHEPAVGDGSRGGAALHHKDHAGETVASPHRLHLRARAVEAELMLEKTALALEACLVRLEAATDRHQGATPRLAE